MFLMKKAFHKYITFAMQIAWVGIPTAPAWLPTDMLIKVVATLTTFALLQISQFICILD